MVVMAFSGAERDAKLVVRAVVDQCNGSPGDQRRAIKGRRHNAATYPLRIFNDDLVAGRGMSESDFEP